MKKLRLIGLVVLVVGLLITGLVTPIFGHSPDDDEATPANGEAWEAMHEACESGDWEAMAEAAEGVHGEDLDYMPCHGEGDYTPNRWGGMAGHMVGGMMGW